MSIVARCKAAARLPTRRGRQPLAHLAPPIGDLGAFRLWTSGTAMPTTTPPKGATRPALPRELSRIKQEASSSSAVTETTWPAHHQLQVTHVLGSTRRRRNSAPAVTSPLSRSCSWSVRRRLDMSEAAPDCSPTAMSDGRVAPTIPAADGLLRAGGSSRRDATLRRTSRSPASPATARRAADEAAAIAGLRELAIGEHHVVADEASAAAASRRMTAAAAAAPPPPARVL